MALATSPRPQARPTGPAWEKTVRTQRDRERSRSRVRRDVRQRLAAPPKNIDPTPRTQFGGVLRVLRRMNPIAMAVAPNQMGVGTLDADTAALAANYEAVRTYGQSRAAAPQIGPNVDYSVPSLVSPLPPAWMIPELNPLGVDVLTREEPEPLTYPEADAPLEMQEAFFLPRPASPRMQEQLESIYAPRTSARPRTRPKTSTLEIKVSRGPRGPKISQRVRVRPSKRPKRGRKERKNTSKVFIIQRVITKTYGAYTEARDFVEAVVWAVYRKSPNGEVYHAALSMSYRDIALAILEDDPSIRVDWLGVVQNVAIMQAQDRAIGEFSKRRQKALNAAGWSNPLGIDAMSSSGQSSLRSSAIEQDRLNGTDNREIMNALQQKPSLLRELSQALDESLDRKARTRALFD